MALLASDRSGRSLLSSPQTSTFIAPAATFAVKPFPPNACRRRREPVTEIPCWQPPANEQTAFVCATVGGVKTSAMVSVPHTLWVLIEPALLVVIASVGASAVRGSGTPVLKVATALSAEIVHESAV